MKFSYLNLRIGMNAICLSLGLRDPDQLVRLKDSADRIGNLLNKDRCWFREVA